MRSVNMSARSWDCVRWSNDVVWWLCPLLRGGGGLSENQSGGTRTQHDDATTGSNLSLHEEIRMIYQGGYNDLQNRLFSQYEYRVTLLSRNCASNYLYTIQPCYLLTNQGASLDGFHTTPLYCYG